MNMAMLTGRVGKQPEIRNTNSGQKIASFSLATSESWRDKATGERKEKTEWHNVVVFQEGLAKVVEKYVGKGDQLAIVGKIQTREWEKEGVKRYSTEMVLNGFDAKLEMLGGNKGGRDRDDGDDDRGERSDSRGSSGGNSRSGGGGSKYSHTDMDDDIPFSCEWR